MNERELRGLIEDVRIGKLSRRAFVRGMVAVGLTAPLAAQMLSHSGIAMAAPFPEYKPTQRGGGGPLRLLWWQGPTLLNPHFAVGTKDQDGSRLFYEPLAAWDADGNLVPILAAEIPSLENGGLAEDGMSVTWKLKQGVTWHDGEPFTADDCVFNWEYATDPDTAAVTIGSYQGMNVVKVDDHTVRVEFEEPTPFWADPFVGTRGMLIPKHLFQDFKGAASRDAPANLAPVGTGPYLFEQFNPGDLVTGKLNPNYHEENRPYFDSIEMKGGGDAVSAARAVLQTGEYDLAWNMQVEDELLKRLEEAGKGHIEIMDGGDIEHIQINNTDPWTEVDGERSSLKTKHPFLTDPAVRKALNLLVDRGSVEQHIYGRGGPATANFLNNPEQFRSTKTSYEFDVEKAVAILEEGGWTPGADGIREKDGVKLKFVYQTSINAPRQKTQAIVKQACQKAGIEVELKSITASVFFSSDEANPDTYTKFYCDIQMYTTTQTQPDPGVFMNQFLSWEVATKANKWQGRNITRWTNPEYDKLYREAEAELDPVKRAALFIRMNEMVIEEVAVIPVVSRPRVAALSNKLHAPLSGWDNYTAHLKDWYRDA
ncbi:peptide ABC transporter substrate-binding protein [Chelativorans xinjiangense]|uniref:peptide ABC transporter substrate-binding protein n=1 Tax=Chelativorans xinjiangense TaxID=2681485 RepID=UPI00135A3BEE|nr:peptide ABC transporter substrate-binding protein [Chelativorans xinjiangense]